VYEYLMYFFPFFLTHLSVYALAHWGLPARYILRGQQEAVFLLFNHMRACFIVALGIKVSPPVGGGPPHAGGRNSFSMISMINIIP
jgi:hypothetical protein